MIRHSQDGPSADVQNIKPSTTVCRTFRLASLIRPLAFCRTLPTPGTGPLDLSSSRRCILNKSPFQYGARSSRLIPAFQVVLPYTHNMRVSLFTFHTHVLIVSRPVSPRVYPDLPTPLAFDPSCLLMARSPMHRQRKNCWCRGKMQLGQGKASNKHQNLSRVKLPMGWAGPPILGVLRGPGHVGRSDPWRSESRVTDR